MIGTVLAGKYRIEAQLFVDKLGTAFRGRTVSGGTSLLVLVLDAAIQPTREQLDHILAVSKQIRDLNHPALVPTIDWIRVDGQVALISPRNDAIPFEEFCKGGIGLAETVDLASQIGEAVQVARDAGVAHKDLSSHSILVSIPAEGGQVPRIFFWGYDILLPPYSVGKKDDKFWGTPEFMAPELCSGKGWNPQSDVYSIGILLFQLVTGKPPFISTNYNTTMKRQIYEKPLPLNLLKRGIPHIAEFEKIVFEALQKMVAKRPESTRAVAGLLVDFKRSYLPEAATTPLQVVNWPSISFSGDQGTAAPTTSEPAGTLTFRGLGEAAEKAAAETRIEGATSGATLQFQAAPVEESTAKFEPAAVAPAPAAVVETKTAVMEVPIASPAPKADPEPPKGKKDKKSGSSPATAVGKAGSSTLSSAGKPDAALSDSARKRIEEETRQLEETGDDWFVDGSDAPKQVAEMPLPSEDRKPGPSTKEWRLWALIAVVSLAIVAVLIWLLSPGAPDDATKKAPAPPAPKTQSLTKVPMSDTPVADTKQKGPEGKQPDTAEAATKAKASEEASALAKKQAEEAAAIDAAKKAAADAQAKKAAQDEAERLAAQEAAKKAAAEAEAAKKAAEAAAAAAASGDEAAKRAQEAAAAEAAKKAQEAAAAEAAKKAQEEAVRAAQNAEAAKIAQEAAAKKAAEEAAKKAAADAAAKKAAEDAAKKAAEDAAKKGGDDAAAKKAAADAAAKKAAEDAAKKAAADAAAKKAAEDAAKKDEEKKDESAGGDAAEQAKKFKGMGIKALKKGNCPLAIRYFETAKKYAPEDTTIDKFIEKCKEGGGE